MPLRILVYSYDRVGVAMAGPAIRAVAIARELSRRWEVTLGLHHAPDLAPAGLHALHPVRPGDIARFDLLVSQVTPVKLLAVALASGRRLVIDGYDPLILEELEGSREAPRAARVLAAALARRRARVELLAADHLLAANERQRDFYLGQLALLGRLGPGTDPSGAPLVGLAPFGIDQDDPPPQRLLKGKVAGVGRDDEVLLWGGGLWSWLDPLTAIRAMPEIARRHPRAKLVFLGTRHPNPDVRQGAMLERALAEARTLGLEGRSVVFNDGWVPYAERGAYLADADLGVSLHGGHLEAHFASRTRILDYLWAGLPMVLARGDVLAELAEREGAAIGVPAGDTASFAEAVTAALEPAWNVPARARARALRGRFRWPVVLAPLVCAVERIAEGSVHAPRRARARALAGLPAYALLARAVRALAARPTRPHPRASATG